MGVLPQINLITPASSVLVGAAVRFSTDPLNNYLTEATTVTVEWNCGGQYGTAVHASTSIEHSFIIPVSLYDEFPDTADSITLELKCHAFASGMEYLGYTTKNITVYANEYNSSPTISLPTVSAVDDLSLTLTGSAQKLIRYVSKARVNVRAEARNALLSSVMVWNGDGEAGNINAFEQAWINGSCDLYKISTRAFHVRATDLRGFETTITYTLPAERFVEYIKLTCNADYGRPDTSGNMRLSCSGNYFNQSFGQLSNTLYVEYRYYANNGAWTNWAPMTTRTSGNTYNAYVDITGLDYQTKYTFECRANDQVMTATSADLVAKSTPVFDWSENDFAFNVPVDFRAGIMANGKETDIIVEQGKSGIWYYRKWSSGLAECWGQRSTNLYSQAWKEWNGMYQATLMESHPYPFAFTDTQREYATIQSMCGGFLDGVAIGMSQSTTGSYYLTHPNKLSSSYSCLLNLYVVGRWK